MDVSYVLHFVDNIKILERRIRKLNKSIINCGAVRRYYVSYKLIGLLDNNKKLKSYLKININLNH